MKTNQTILILTIAILTAITLASAETITQISPNPNTGQINYIRMDSNGYALLHNLDGNYFKWNGTELYEIYPPNVAINKKHIKMDKTLNKIYVLAYNNTNYALGYEFWEYDASVNETGGWTWLKNGTFVIGTQYGTPTLTDMGCNPYTTDDLNSCQLMIRNATGSGYTINPYTGSQDLPDLPTTITTGAKIFPRHNTYYYSGTTLHRSGLYSWTSSLVSPPSIRIFWDADTNYWGYTTNTGQLCRYSQISASVYCISSVGKNLMVETDDESFLAFDELSSDSSGTHKKLNNYFDNTTTIYNSSVAVACAVSDYEYMSDYQTGQSYINGLTTCNSNTRVFQIGLSEAQTETPTTTTNYTLNAYKTNNDYGNIYGITPVSSNRLYSMGISYATDYITSVDWTNPNNPVYRNKTINDTTSYGWRYQLSYSDGTIYLATEDDIYKWTNASNGDARNIIQDNTTYYYDGITYDRTIDISAEDNDEAWMCHEGITGHDGKKYENGTIPTNPSLTANPCLSVLYNNGYVYFHTGTSIYIYNAITNTSVATITELTSPTEYTQDAISIRGSKLFVISGNNAIKKYDISNPANPTEETNCVNTHTGTIVSLEALTLNTAVIGIKDTGTNKIMICNWQAQDTYIPDVYTATTIYSSLDVSNERPYEIARLSDTSFATAQETSIGYYTFTINTEQIETNEQPTINSITLTKNTMCINETTRATILATDNEDDTLTYDYDCSGTQTNKINSYLTNTFSCSYTTNGTKTIKAWASDGTNTPTTSSKSVLVNDCVATPQIEVKVLDGNTGNLVVGATATLTGTNGSTKTTDNAGVVLWQNLVNSETYQISITKDGYFPINSNVYTSSSQQIAYLEPTTTETGATTTALTIIVKDNQTLNPISDVLVSVNEPSTGKSKYAFTDNTGTALITNMFSTTKGLLTTSYGTLYVQTSQYFTISSGEQKTITIYILNATKNYSTTRGCQDYIEGIMICSPRNITLNGDNCQNDADCLSGRCEPSVGTRTCSIFNWTQCDSIGMDRANQCYAKVMGGRGFTNLTDAMLDNFLFVLVAVFLFIGAIMFINSVVK